MYIPESVTTNWAGAPQTGVQGEFGIGKENGNHRKMYMGISSFKPYKQPGPDAWDNKQEKLFKIQVKQVCGSNIKCALLNIIMLWAF